MITNRARSRAEGWVNPVDRLLLAIWARITRAWRTHQAKPRWVRRLRAIGLLMIGAVFVPAGAAYAADDEVTTGAPSAFSWISVKDSAGNPIWNYQMAIDRGGATSPGKLIWGFLTDLLWGLYQVLVALAIWLIDWVLAFGWLDLIAGPVVEVGDAMSSIVTSLGATGTLLTITACVGAWMMVRGQFATGMFEIAIACVISALAVGVFSDPVRDVVEQGGLLTDSRDVGLVLALGLRNDGDLPPTGSGPMTPPERGFGPIGEGPSVSGTLRRELTGSMVDAFIRIPHQLTNFGTYLDEGDCAETYAEQIDLGDGELDNAPPDDDSYGGIYGGVTFGNGALDQSELSEQFRNAIKDCNEAAGRVAENPNSGMALSAAALLPAGGLAMLFAFILCGVVLSAGLFAAYQSVKAIVALLMALAPGGARGTLWMTAAELIIALVTVVYSVVFLSVYLLVITAVFTSDESSGNLQTFIAVDILMLVGVIVYWKGRGRLKAASARLAAAMSKRPGKAAPTALPARSSASAADLYYKGRMVKNALGGRVGKGLGLAGAIGLGAATGGVSTLVSAGTKVALGKGKESKVRERLAGGAGEEKPSPTPNDPGSGPPAGFSTQPPSSGPPPNSPPSEAPPPPTPTTRGGAEELRRRLRRPQTSHGRLPRRRPVDPHDQPRPDVHAGTAPRRPAPSRIPVRGGSGPRD